MSKLLFVGCGKMGGAILCRTSRKSDQVVVIDPAHGELTSSCAAQILWASSPDRLDPSFSPDVIILAVKPGVLSDILPLYARFKSSLFLSIVAGKTILHLGAILQNSDQPIVRAMPNLPASIGQGITVAVANHAVSKIQYDLCDEILRSIGDVSWIHDEALIDPVTALSGSGPAYVFALVETMAAAGEKLGLAPELAKKLARKTIIGSGALLGKALGQTKTPAADLRKATTTAGGTTAAALEVLLNEKGLPDVIFQAMKAAMERSIELSANSCEQRAPKG